MCLAQGEAELNLGLLPVCRCGALPSPLPPARILGLFPNSPSPSLSYLKDIRWTTLPPLMPGLLSAQISLKTLGVGTVADRGLEFSRPPPHLQDLGPVKGPP